VLSRLNSYNFGTGIVYGNFTAKLLNEVMQRSPLATCHHRSSMLKAPLEGSIVLTIALGLALTMVQPRSIRSGSIV
jgi:hypothetical protein